MSSVDHDYWYPDEVDRRPLQVSWLFDTKSNDAGFVHESDLPVEDDALRSLFVDETGIPDMSGYISIVFCNEELLGRRFWVYEANLVGFPMGTHTFARAGQEVRIEPDGEQFVKFTRTGGTDSDRILQLPRQSFFEEWLCMLYRVSVIRSFCGSTDQQTGVLRMAERWVRPPLLDYLRTAPLASILENPMPFFD